MYLCAPVKEEEEQQQQQLGGRARAPAATVALGEMDAPPKDAPPWPPAGSATRTRPESTLASSQPVGQPVSGEKRTASVGSDVSKVVT